MKTRHMVLVEITFDKPTPETQATALLERLLRDPAAVHADREAAAAVESDASAIAYQVVASALTGSGPSVAAYQRGSAS